MCVYMYINVCICLTQYIIFPSSIFRMQGFTVPATPFSPERCQGSLTDADSAQPPAIFRSSCIMYEAREPLQSCPQWQHGTLELRCSHGRPGRTCIHSLCYERTFTIQVSLLNFHENSKVLYQKPALYLTGKMVPLRGSCSIWQTGRARYRESKKTGQWPLALLHNPQKSLKNSTRLIPCEIPQH